MYLAEIFVTVFLGAILGSFSSALIYRIPRGLDWASVRSMCCSCGSKLAPVDLIPLFSWCLFKGKCRHCFVAVSCRYPLVELISVFLCLGAYFTFGISAEYFFVIAAIPLLVSLFVIDLEHMILPNQLNLILFVIGGGRVFYGFVSGEEYWDYLGGGVIYLILAWGLAFLFSVFLKKDALGVGDIKFFGVAGIWLGASILPYFLIISGGVAVLFALCWRMIKKTEVFPFGPALIMSLYVLLLFRGVFFT